MEVVLTRGRRHRRIRAAKKYGGGIRGTHRTALDYLMDVAITASESGYGAKGSGLPVVVVVDGGGPVQPTLYGGSTGSRESRRSKSRGPVNAFEEHLSQLHDSEQMALRGYATRIDSLRVIVEEDGGTISEDSEQDFWDFVRRYPLTEPGQVVVTSEGHLRLVWKGNDEAHIGIRFLGDRRVRYVIFNRRAGERALIESSGDDTFDGLVGQARACGLRIFRA